MSLLAGAALCSSSTSTAAYTAQHQRHRHLSSSARGGDWGALAGGTQLGKHNAKSGRRGHLVTPKANWVTDALFKGKEAKALEEFAKSDAGKRAAEKAAKGGGLNSLLEFGQKEARLPR